MSPPQNTDNAVFDSSLDFKAIDFRRRPDLYRIGKGEQGVLLVEPYKGEILPHWRFKTVAAVAVVPRKNVRQQDDPRFLCHVFNRGLTARTDMTPNGRDDHREHDRREPYFELRPLGLRKAFLSSQLFHDNERLVSLRS